MINAQQVLVTEIASVKKQIRDFKKELEKNKLSCLSLRKQITESQCILKKLCRECAFYDDHTKEMRRQMNRTYGSKGGRNPLFGQWEQEEAD